MKIYAFSSDAAASYALPVRRASALPAASFRFHLAMDTLAVRLPVPPAGSGEDFHLQVHGEFRAKFKGGCNSIQNKTGWCFPLAGNQESSRIIVAVHRKNFSTCDLSPARYPS
ncbi:hypothetical protein GD605_16360 [Desulfolutivibrio sulfoxidireducens]|nr:hypothetical protein GD605_16360 [Desulfolutivibrio sulfoxidireducens]